MSGDATPFPMDAAEASAMPPEAADSAVDSAATEAEAAAPSEAGAVDADRVRALEAELEAELRRVNEQLWEIEDSIREHERQQRFDAAFIALARAVYRTNDQRADLKRRINALVGSELVEEKSYAAY